MLGGSYPLTEVALRGFDPLSLVLLRLTIGSLFILVWMRARGQTVPRNPRVLAMLVAVGLLNTVGSFFLVTWGQKYVTASYTAILLASNPIFAAAGAALLLPVERLTLRGVAGVGVGFCGVIVLFSDRLSWGGDAANGKRALLGAVAILGGAVCLAIVALTVRIKVPLLMPAELAFPMLLTGVVSIGVAEVALVASGAVTPRLDARLWPVVATVVLGVLNAGIGNVVYYTLIRAWGVTRTALVGYLVPFVGVALGAGLLHDRIRPHMIVGLALITISLLFVNAVPVRLLIGRA